ncbi:hypothetical protein BU16DRAFT_50823 [Lophium mytilinum]|uniref:Uncharacterized protein n=1 Tax=Lophium mytilinum TaxID=390894 RepID=A0A6A6QQY0_9PEZI|nr:hypothetical protein BU16DRAFT_50823 [Lophium mytilinum]
MFPIIAVPVSAPRLYHLRNSTTSPSHSFSVLAIMYPLGVHKTSLRHRSLPASPGAGTSETNLGAPSDHLMAMPHSASRRCENLSPCRPAGQRWDGPSVCNLSCRALITRASPGQPLLPHPLLLVSSSTFSFSPSHSFDLLRPCLALTLLFSHSNYLRNN